MGLISPAIMLRYGYDKRLASGVIAASGTLARSFRRRWCFIIMADQLGKSVGDMYEGAFVPGPHGATSSSCADQAQGLPLCCRGARSPDAGADSS